MKIFGAVCILSSLNFLNLNCSYEIMAKEERITLLFEGFQHGPSIDQAFGGLKINIT